MESTRFEEEKKVESEFIQKWLCLGLPIGPSWTMDLAKHLNKSSREGLLLIIDGLESQQSSTGGPRSLRIGR